jgi:hypothetical protein
MLGGVVAQVTQVNIVCEAGVNHHQLGAAQVDGNAKPLQESPSRVNDISLFKSISETPANSEALVAAGCRSQMQLPRA